MWSWPGERCPGEPGPPSNSRTTRDEYLWEYDSATGAWTALGMFGYGTVDSINAYPHGLSYTPGGTRLHMSYCWRKTSNASTNHDLYYICLLYTSPSPRD